MIDRLLRRLPSLLMARRNLSRSKVRSGLAVLGIVIGVVAIAGIGILGVTLEYSVTQNFQDLGNEVIVSPDFENEDVTSLTRRDVREIRAVAGGATVVPAKRAFVPVTFDRGDPEETSVRGISHPGRIYTATRGTVPDRLRSGAVIGNRVAIEREIGPGDTLSVNGSTFRVKAVIGGGGGFDPLQASGAIVLPASASPFPRDDVSRVYAVAESGRSAPGLAAEIRSTLNEREDRVRVREFSDILNRIDSQFRTINTVLLGIASISLLVAGVSILNVMLMSAIERREEIGVLRAVGYQRRDVLKVMLTEAGLLGVVGGLVGIGLSVAAGLVINQVVVGDPTLVFRAENVRYIGAAFGFGFGTSVVSGLYPAWKAARAEPVEALRS